MNTIAKSLEELTSAEEFFDQLSVPYNSDVLQGRRVHVLRFFNHFIESLGKNATFEDYQGALKRAYCLIERNVRIELNAAPCQTCKGCDDDS